MTAIDDYLQANSARFENDLCELLRIPSVSADSKYKADVRRAGQWVLERFKKLGLKAEMIETAGHPLVYAESPPLPGAPTILVYGHFDVQPPDPLNLWVSPPFEPTRRDGNIYARGATDDKGQMLTHVFSTEAWLKTQGELPLQLKFLIEGEEEVGSENLYDFIAANHDKLRCDVAVISDCQQFGPGRPAITYGLRGLAYFEVVLTGPKQDLHSGTFGGAVADPAVALTKMMAALIDERGSIQVPAFYDDVLPLTDQERKQFAALPFDEKGYKKQLGVDALAGEEGYTTIERRSARPTFTINGLTGGYQGEGAKTVLPSKASAKFSFRLVPNQDPKKIARSVEKKLRELCPAGVKMEFLEHSGAPGVVVPLDSPYVAAASRAIEDGFGRAPVFMREGGSIPVVSAIKQDLKADTLLLGWGLDDDNTHSPNEKFCLADFHRGIKASAKLWDEIAKIKQG